MEPNHPPPPQETVMKSSRSLLPGKPICGLMLLFGILTGVCHGAGGQASAVPVDLRCEYLTAPLGIDVLQPRLSWRLAAIRSEARGQRQTAYQVLVASSRELLHQNRGDLWSSGMVTSDQSVHVVYNGKPLTSGSACYWKVRIQDEDSIASDWSEPARWTMGLLVHSDWSAQWIGSDRLFRREKGWPPPDNKVPDPWLRKSFQLAGAPSGPPSMWPRSAITNSTSTERR
jgi:hypothetical protein